MVRVTQPEPYDHNNDAKSHLVIDTCNIYHNYSHFSCIHHHHHLHHDHHLVNNTTAQPTFIDWYLILRVAEDASIATVRKQYHKLALLLHPDKNNHPKSEFAFKLISQAYKCLSDDAKRNSFNLERWRNQCTECSNIQVNAKTHLKCNTNNSKRHSTNSTKNSRSCKIQQRFRAIREQLIEEAKVIEGCIRVNQGPKNEHPVFNPSSYMHLGYPHRRSHPLFYKEGASFQDGQTRNVVPNYDQRRRRCESPIFEPHFVIRTEHIIGKW